MNLNALGTEAARDPAVLERKKRRIAQTRLPWCPPEYVELARKLRGQRFSASEVKTMVLEQYERDLKRFRSSILGRQS